ncbi:MAG TPA: M13-type metalloendopeptidase [Telluria sp.]|nr:M13-type metalloendopeptidase [Telluria sp.]
MKRQILTTLALSIATAFGSAYAAPVSGIETQHVDPSVRAQDDFYQHLNGGWIKTAEIPADRSSWGTFAKLREDTTPQVRALIEAAQKDKSAKAGSETRKIGDFYATYMDEQAIDKLGYKPLAGELQRIRSIKDKKALPALMANLAKIGVSGPYRIGVSQDARASTVYATYISQSGLGMPDRDYYLKKDDAKLAAVRDKYLKHVETIMALAGHKDAAAKAAQILALETQLAESQWTRVENRDANKRYNKFEVSKLDTLAPGYDWKGALAAAGVGGKTDYVIVSQPSYISGFHKTLEAQPLEAWKSYFEFHLLRNYSEYLSKPFVDADFEFYGKTISGVTEQRPRWKRAAASTEAVLGEAVGKMYVKEHFPAERKARMEVLVKNLMAAYKDSIDNLDWMSPETKKEAQAKLAKFSTKIGYPNKWRDYSKYKVVKGDLVGNMMRASQFGYARNIEKLGQPIDREEWGMTPQTINAYYRSTMNEIVFPAAILQPPFFDANADDAVNYGAIGAVIGHEISHGFDDNGSKSDGDGNLRDWWTEADRKNFMTKADALTKQYDAYSPIPGYNVNGKLTLGENIADNSGLAIAYKAYKLSLGGQPAPVIDGLTGEQRFYMGFGQVWRAKMRDEAMIVQLKTDPHSPGQYRANGTVQNQPGFYEAFDVKEGDKMYVAPEKRVIIW